MNKVLTIVPSRGRPEKIQDFYKSFKTNSVISDLCIGIDSDDVEYPDLDGVIYEVNKPLGMNGTLNLIANKYANDYKYLAFLGDDHRPRTYGWDSILVEELDKLNNGVAYGNDLLQGNNLPTAVMLDSNIVRALGYMAPPTMTHLYIDNFWKALGERLGTLQYRQDVIIEHMHYSNGKSEPDDRYMEVNSMFMLHKDNSAFNDYINNHFESDIKKLIG